MSELKRLVLLVILVIGFQVSFANSCERIVSLSPSTTDILIDVGLEKNIVGATRYCLLSKQTGIADIGGYFDLNYEQVYQLDPTLIVMQGVESQKLYQELEEQGYNLLALNLDHFDSIMESSVVIKQYCSLQSLNSDKSREALSEIQRERVAYQNDVNKVLLFYGQGEDYGRVIPKTAVGESFHSELLTYLNIENAYQGKLNALTLSAEAIYRLAPDYIIILESDSTVTFDKKNEISIRRLTVDWGLINRIGAVKNNRVFLLKGFATQIPSPSSLQSLAEALDKIIE